MARPGARSRATSTGSRLGGARPRPTTSTPAPGASVGTCAARAASSARAGTLNAAASQSPSVSSAADRGRTRAGSSTPGSWGLWRVRMSSAACAAVRQPSSTAMPARARITASPVPRAPAPMIATRRSGGIPPSHSHCSSMHGQIRSVTAAASRCDGFSTSGKRSARPTRSRTRCGRMRQPRRTASVPITAIGTTGAPVSSASRPTPRLGVPSGPGRTRVPSGKITSGSPRSRIAFAVTIASPSEWPRSTGKAPRQLRNHAWSGLRNSSRLAT